MIKCTRKISFDTAHRIIGHKSKCKYLHGHRYVLEVTVIIDVLDELGMVADFGFLKEVIKPWIDHNFDHNIILHEDDKTLGEYVSKYTSQNVYYLKENPTAENIALHLHRDIIPKLFAKSVFRIYKARLYETPNCYAEVK